MKKIHILFFLTLLAFCTHKSTSESAIINLIKKNQILDIFSFLDKHHLDLANTYSKNRTLLHFGVIYNNQDLIQRLVEEGAALDAQDDDGNTPLLLSIINHHSDITFSLIDLQANLDIQNNDGDTAFILACKRKDTSLINVLISNKVNPNLKNHEDKRAIDFLSSDGEEYKTLAKYALEYNKAKLKNVSLSLDFF